MYKQLQLKLGLLPKETGQTRRGAAAVIKTDQSQPLPDSNEVLLREYMIQLCRSNRVGSYVEEVVGSYLSNDQQSPTRGAKALPSNQALDITQNKNYFPVQQKMPRQRAAVKTKVAVHQIKCNPATVIQHANENIAFRMKGTKCVVETPTSEDMPDVKVMNENA